jgi:malonyl CoA-acyl carrier protein transacylase
VLAGVEIKRPRIPVISNVDAKPHSDPETIKKLLATQVSACTWSFIHSSMKQTILSHR